MKIVFLFWFCVVISFATECQSEGDDSPDVKPKKTRNGYVYNNLSRSNLLKVLAAFEESVNNQFYKKNVKPVFTANYENNKFTNLFIYPQVLNSIRAKTAALGLSDAVDTA